MKKVAFVLMCVCLAVSMPSFADEKIVYENDYEGETPGTAFDEGGPWNWLDNLTGPHTCTYQDDGTGNIVVHHNGHIDNSGGAEDVNTRFGTQWGLTISGNTSPFPEDYIIEFDINSVSGNWDPIALEFFVLTNNQGYGSGPSDYNQADGWVHVEYNMADLGVPWWNGTNWDLTSSTWRIEVGGPPWPGTSVPAGTPAWDQVWVMDNLKITQISDPTKSYNPDPPNGATSVNVDPILSWTPGIYAELHDIYFGTDFNDVNDANRGNPMDVLAEQGYGSNSYGPLALEYETTYYWRIDDVNDPNIYKGNVWSFTTSKEYLAGIIVYENDYEDQTPGNIFDEGNAWNWGTDYCAHSATYQDYSGNIVVEHLGAINNTTAEAQNCRFGSKWDITMSGNTSSDPMDYIIEFDLRSVSGSWDPVNLEFFVLTKEASDQGYGSGASNYSQADGWVHVKYNLADLTIGWWQGTDWDLTNSEWSIEVGGPPYPGTSVPAGQAWNQVWLMDNLKIIELVGAKSYNPDPPNGAAAVTVNPILSWTPGANADKHDVYFGTDETAVTDANITVTLGVLEKQNHDSNSYGPLALEYETTYYWRIDEVNGPNTWKGNVWSFTTEPNIPITDPNLLCWLKFDDIQGSAAIDSSGHSNHGTIVGGASWGSGMLEGALEFDGTDDYVALPLGDEVNSMNDVTIATWVNFSNEGGEWQRIFDFGNGTDEYMFLTPRLGAGGVMRFAISVTSYNDEDVVDAPATLASGWHHVTVMIDSGTTPYTLKLYLDGAEVGFNPSGDVLPSDLGATTNNWLGRSQYAADAYFTGSLDDFRIYNKLLPEQELRELVSPPWAWGPNPLGGATNVKSVPKPILSWFPGKYAHKHDVYFGTDEVAVTDANRSNPLGVLVSENQDACSYDPCEIDFGTTYYWRVDEVNMSYDPNIIGGDVWSFTTANYIEIDNFDRYPSRDDLRAVWIDGYDAFTSGSNVTISRIIDSRYPAGHTAPGPIHQGTDALQFVYDNDKNIWIYVPGYTPFPYGVLYYFSEMEATIDALECVSDWTTEDVKMLSLQFSGDPDNDIDTYEQMYIALEDGDGDIALVKYGDSAGEDTNNLLSRDWTEWAIDLQEFEDANASFNIEDVNKVYIGFGERFNNTTAGGSGVVYFDSIRLDWAKCVPAMAPASDLSDDCMIDIFDFILLADSWGAEQSTAIPIIDLNASDFNSLDKSWPNTDGTLGGRFDVNIFDMNDNPTAGIVDGLAVVTFDGNDYLVSNFSAPGGITGANDFTVIAKVFNPVIAIEEWIIQWARRGGPAGTTSGLGYGTDAAWGAVIHWNEGDEEPDMGFDGGVPIGDMWHQIAVTYNGITEKVLVDGKLNAVEGEKILDVYADDPVVVGGSYDLDPNDPNDPNDPPDFITTILHFSGSVNRIRVYDEALAQHQLEYIMTGRFFADLNGDGEVDFKDLAMMLDDWLKEKLFP